MPSRIVQSDDEGAFIVIDGQRYRHGPLYMPRPAMRHDDGGLRKGDKAMFRRIPCAPAVVVSARDGGETVWETEDCKRSARRRAATLPAEPTAIRAILGGPIIGTVTSIQADKGSRT